MLTEGRQLRQLINRLPCVKSQPSSLKAGREQSLSLVAASMSERPGPETDDERRRTEGKGPRRFLAQMKEVVPVHYSPNQDEGANGRQPASHHQRLQVGRRVRIRSLRRFCVLSVSAVLSRGSASNRRITQEASKDASRWFGNRTYLTEMAREIRGGAALDTLWQDLRYGARIPAQSSLPC